MDLHGLWSRLTGARPSAAAEPPSGVAPADAAPIAAGGRPPAWRTLPPIAPAAHPAPLVAQRSPFEPGLAGAAPTPLALAPLGHERSLEAPAGLVTAVHAPVVARAADPLPGSVRPIGRGRRHDPAGSAARASATWPADDEPADATQPDVVPGPSLDAAPVRPAPVAARSVDAASLTVAPAIDAPGGFVGRAPVPAATAGGGSHEADAPLPSVIPTTDELEPPPVPLPLVPGPTDLAVARTVADPVPAPPAPLVARHNLGQSRRLRIGPAIEPVARPASAGGLGPTMQRAIESTPDPMPQLPPDLPVERRIEPGEAASAGLSVARSVGSHAADHPDHGPEAVAAAMDADAPVASDPAAAGAPSSPVQLRPLAGERPPIAPLLGTLRPTFDAASPAVAIARAPDDEVDETAPTGVAAALAALNAPGGLPAPDGAPTIARLADGAPGRTGPTGSHRGGPGAAGGSGGRGESLGRSAGRPQAGDAALPGRPSTGSASVPVVARSLASGTGASPSAFGAAARRPASQPDVPAAGTARLRVAAAVSRSVAPDTSAGGAPSTPPTVAAGPPVAPSTGDASPATVFRAVADAGAWAGASSDEPTGAAADGLVPVAGIQRAVDSTPTPAAPASGGAPGAAGPTSGPELDALAARLYERIRLRLRRELLADRERAGVLVDMGH